MAKIGHDAKAIAFAKWSVWLKNEKCQKDAKSDCTTTLELLCARKPLQNDPIFEKCEHFESGQNWPRRKGYSLCKMFSLAQKCQKGAKNDCTTTLKLLCVKKPFQKKPNIRKMRAF